eukprot:TRINITY_DN10699_c0_g1_i1.p1 TRINITY_DN10699_c0_g1~~TRINITY_DN10699_c0_g1_i1.p1  ORF type:complete len:609 (+),score=195.19 TRINITY_DN10699_c0_g1_i1:82-1908(+)
MARKRSKSKPQRPGPPQAEEVMTTEIDDFIEQRQFVSLDANPHQEDEEPQQLANEVMGLRSDSDSDSSSGGGGKRSRPLYGAAYSSSEEDDSLSDGIMGERSSDELSDSSENEGEWGRRKRSYYNTDYVDSEMIHSDDEAQEEEEEALRQQKRNRREQEAEEDSYLETFADMLQGGATATGVKSALSSKAVGDLATFDAEEAETIVRDLSSLSRPQKLEILMNDSPELLKLLSVLKETVEELQDKILPLKRRLLSSGVDLTSSPGTTYVITKSHLMLSYTINVFFYLLLKASSLPAREHPVVQTLVSLDTLMNALKPLEEDMAEEIAALHSAVQSPEDSSTEVAPEPSQTEIGKKASKKAKKKTKRTKEMTKKKSKHSPSFMNEEFAAGSEEEEEDAEIERIRQFELSAMQQLLGDSAPESGTSKKKSKVAKRSFSRMMNVATASREAVPDDSESFNPSKKRRLDVEPLSGSESDEYDYDALLKEMQNAEGGHKGKKQKAKKRAEEKKKSSQLSKQEQELEEYDSYMNEADSADDDSKRGITSQMERNKGLVRHRKKELRNPRVARKMQYQKAQRKRKSTVQTMKPKKMRYGGEQSGISTHTVRSRKL